MRNNSKKSLKRKNKLLPKNKEDVNRIIAKVYKELKDDNTIIIFKNLKGCHGEYDALEDEIYIDLRKEILPTIIHELIHRWHPEKTENSVLRLERHIMQHISLAQSVNIISLLLYKR